MRIRLAALVSLLLLCLSPCLFAAGNKELKSSITFHIETDAQDNPKMIFAQAMAGKTRYFRRMPEIHTKDIQSFNPFPAEGGQGYGVVIRLKSHAKNRLAAITNVNSGKWMLAQVNGRVVDGVLVDKQISDGVLVIWRNISLQDIATLDEDLPRFGQEGKKK